MSEEKMFCPNCGSECDKSEKYCGNCGSLVSIQEENSNETLSEKVYSIKVPKTNISPTILIHIGYIIGAIVMAAILGFGLCCLAPTIASGSGDIFGFMNADNESNVFQQIYDVIQVNIKTVVVFGLILGVAICVVAGLVLDFALSALAKFNSIQKQINETQELIYQHFDVMNERFDMLMNKEKL